MIDVSFAERHLDATLRERVRAVSRRTRGPSGARFLRPLYVRLLRRSDV